MKCDDARIQISRAVDDDLTGEERARLERHVATCADCTRYAQDAERLQALIRRDEVAAPGEAFWQRIEAQAGTALQAAVAIRRRRMVMVHVWAILATAASLALLVALCTRERPAAAPASPVAAKPPGAVEPLRLDLVSLARAAPLTPEPALREQSQAYLVLRQYYQGGLKWLAQDGSQTELGVGGAAGGDIDLPATGLVQVELSLLRLEPEGRLMPLSAPLVLVRAGEEAVFRFAPTNGAGPKGFRYLCAAAPAAAGRIDLTVDLEIGAEGREAPIRLAAAAHLLPGQRAPLAFSRRGDAVYLLVGSARWGAAGPDTATAGGGST